MAVVVLKQNVEMSKIEFVQGDIIKYVQDTNNQIDFVAHGCNCFCRMAAGLAPQMAEAFNCDTYPLEDMTHHGDINKLGNIEVKPWKLTEQRTLHVCNAYTQYVPGRDAKTTAVDLCLRKMQFYMHQHNLHSIALPKIGCGIGGLNFEKTVLPLIERIFSNYRVIIVEYKPS